MDQFSTSEGTGSGTRDGAHGGGAGTLYRRRRSVRVFGIRIGSRRQVIYAAVSLLISVFVNYVFLWPVNHFWALMLFALAVTGVLLNDLPRRQALAGSAGCFAVAGLLYLLIGPAESADSAWRHFLLPRSADTPANACVSPQHALPAGSKLVLLGDHAILLHQGQNVVVLTVGACRSVALFQDEDGVILNADDFDDYGSLLFRILNNQLRVMDGRPAWMERPRDHGATTIYAGGGDEMLRLTYLNPHVLRLSGVFACKGHAPLSIKDDAPIPGAAAAAACLDGRGLELH